MNKLLMIMLVCVPLCAQSTDESAKSAIPPASAALALTRTINDLKIATQVPELTNLVIESIKETVNDGYTMCNPDVTKYKTEAIHIVAEKLRAKGYHVELVNSINDYQQLLVIDWSK